MRERLGPDGEAVDPGMPFSYYGLDSLDAVALAGDLEEWLGYPVAPDIAWDYPTARAVAVCLSGANSAGVETPRASEDASETVAAMLAELDEDHAG
jgi:acyl carrier protein